MARRRSSGWPTPRLNWRRFGPKNAGKLLLYIALAVTFIPLTLAEIYAFLPVPVTPLMVFRLLDGYPLHRTWVPLSKISPHLRYAVIASEDNLFCEHNGFDWKSMNSAIEDWQNGEPLRGASTISQQTAKNLFLLPSRNVARKVLEVPFTFMLEHLWPKQRILEVYLNIAEWGPGVYGAEAAARYHFKTSAARLTPRQAALLASILPKPLKWSAAKPNRYVTGRAASIPGRTRQLWPTYLTCTYYPR